jgi:hypothetical protein
MKTIFRCLSIATILAVLTASIACNSTPNSNAPVGPTGATGATGPALIVTVEQDISKGITVAQLAIPVLQANEPAIPAQLVTDVQTALTQLGLVDNALLAGNQSDASSILADLLPVEQQIEGPDLALINSAIIRAIATAALLGLQTYLTDASGGLAPPTPIPAPGALSVPSGSLAILSTYAHAKKFSKADYTVPACK